MNSVIQVVFFAICIFAGNAASQAPCRQCTGTHTVTFSAGISERLATSFIMDSLKNCATGGLINITKVDKYLCHTACGATSGKPPNVKCTQPGTLNCEKWVFSLTTWRYCGNGGSVVLNRGVFCDSKLICSLTDSLSLTCTKSVVCGGECDCENCGC